MVKLRLRRVGRKKLAVYKIVAADSRASRDGRFIETVGTYNPNINPPRVELSENRVYYWLKSGAKPTDTVRTLLSRNGILMKLNLLKRGFDDAKIKEEFEKWSASQSLKSQRKPQKKMRSKKQNKQTASETETQTEKEAGKETETVPTES